MHLSDPFSRRNVLLEEAALRRSRRNEMAERVAKLRREGLGTPDIATRLGISRRKVVQHLTDAGLTQPRAARTRADA